MNKRNEKNLIFYSDDSVSGYFNGYYEIYQEKLFINKSVNEEVISYEYNFYFSDNDNELILSKAYTEEGLILNKI